MRRLTAAAGCIRAIALGSAAFAAVTAGGGWAAARALATPGPGGRLGDAACAVSETSGPDPAGRPGSAGGGPVSLEKVTRNLRRSYSGVLGLSMSFEQTNSWVDMPESGEVSRGMLWVSDGNRLRMEYSDPKGHLLVSDGTRVWVYVPENKQAVVDSTGAREYAALGRMIMNILGSGEAKVVGHEEIRGVSCLVVTVRDISEPPGLDSVKIWIDPKLWLARALQLTDLNENVTTFVFWNIVRLKKVDEALYSFEAPPGVEVVESPLDAGGRR